MSENPLIMSVIHHRKNPLESKDTVNQVRVRRRSKRRSLDITLSLSYTKMTKTMEEIEYLQMVCNDTNFQNRKCLRSATTLEFWMTTQSLQPESAEKELMYEDRMVLIRLTNKLINIVFLEGLIVALLPKKFPAWWNPKAGFCVHKSQGNVQ